MKFILSIAALSAGSVAAFAPSAFISKSNMGTAASSSSLNMALADGVKPIHKT